MGVLMLSFVISLVSIRIVAISGFSSLSVNIYKPTSSTTLTMGVKVLKQQWSSSSGNSNESSSTPLLQSRLTEKGIPVSNIQFVVDRDWARLENSSLFLNENGEKKINKEDATIYSSTRNDYVIKEIKTLVWEGSCEKSELSNNSIGLKKDKFYVVTATLMSDRIDIRMLQELVSKQRGLMSRCKLTLAPVDEAEYLTGFRSGCMPPICHNKPLQLFVEESITQDLVTDGSNNKNSNNEKRPITAMASIGSGILGQSLLLPLKDFMYIAADTMKSNQSESYPVTSFIRSEAQTYNVADLSRIAQEKRKEEKKKRQNRSREPKDRLAAYRSFKDIGEKSALFRSTARNNEKYQDVQALVEEALQNEGEFQLLMQVNPNDGRGKNALHLAAWRGDIKTVQLLVETGNINSPDLDIVNIISEGVKNYGKSPIFYALTQCREDVIRYLISQGANLLIVNNKGQTPCSLAASHLNKECCEHMYDIERQQLKAGGSFVDYRASHSDNLRYGDLDPRFPMDSANFGEDLNKSLEQFHRSAKCDTLYNGIPTVFSPRSLRPTIRWWNTKDKCSKESSDDVKVKAERQRKGDKQVSSSSRDVLPASIDNPPEPKNLEALEVLKIEDVLLPTSAKNQQMKKYSLLVDSKETVQELESEILASLKYKNSELHDGIKDDKILVETTWGMDCEWKPGVGFSSEHPVATLQLSTRRRSFLVDLQTICQSLNQSPGTGENLTGTTDIEKQLSEVLEKLFLAKELPKLGYGIVQDMDRLMASYAYLPCFSQYLSVVDLQSVASVVYPRKGGGCPKNMSSLQKMGATLLEKRVDKDQQCSDWTTRPLSAEQVEYAILDAAVLPLLFAKILQHSADVERHKSTFFTTHQHLRSTLRYTLLEEPDMNLFDGHIFTYEVPMGRIKRLLSKTFARQSWYTDQAQPDLPRRVHAIRCS